MPCVLALEAVRVDDAFWGPDSTFTPARIACADVGMGLAGPGLGQGTARARPGQARHTGCAHSEASHCTERAGPCFRPGS